MRMSNRGVPTMPNVSSAVAKTTESGTRSGVSPSRGNTLMPRKAISTSAVAAAAIISSSSAMLA
jgi:hypothetical protein